MSKHSKEYLQEYYSRPEVKERRKKYLKEYARKNREKLKKYKSEYYFKNKDKNAEKRKKYREEHKEKHSASKSAYKIKRKGRLGKIGKMFKKEIKEIYAKRKKGQHVDHIIPICGEKVTGLHVPWNLRVVSSIENISKNNYVDLVKESKIQLSLSLKDLTRRES